jgi:hypothetical protein
MVRHYALIDTCIWLDLAIDPVADEIATSLEQLLDSTHLSLVVPAIIEEEFDRHKDDCAEKLALRLSKRVQETFKYVQQFGDPAGKTELLAALEQFKNRIAQVECAADMMIQRIEIMLRHPENKRIPHSSRLYELAARRGCEKIAPFIENKNSVADAVILESFLEFHAMQEGEEGCTFSFVTANKSDFCGLKDKRNPHPALGEPFTSGKVRFSINIAEELNTLSKTILPPGNQKVKEISKEAISRVNEWPGIGINLTRCPECKEGAMMFIGAYPSAYGGWSVWQMCGKCGFRWDTGDPMDD